MDLNPLQVITKVWPMRYGPPLLLLEAVLLAVFIVGAILLATNVAVKALNPNAQIPLLSSIAGWKLFGYAALGGIVLMVLLGFGLALSAGISESGAVSTPNPPTKEAFVTDNKDIHITSINQQGGITAYQVNVQPGDRVLNTETARGLEEALKAQKFTSIDVTSVLGDGESFQFASQIKAYLESKGYKVDGVSQVVYSAPLRGQIIQPADNNGILHIRIGTR